MQPVNVGWAAILCSDRMGQIISEQGCRVYLNNLQSERRVIPGIQGIQGTYAVGGLYIDVKVESETALRLAPQHAGKGGRWAHSERGTDIVRASGYQVADRTP
jgi:hypothetical protein